MVSLAPFAPPRHAHDVAWLAPQPMWRAGAVPAANGAAGRPAILRFETDGFMDDLAAAMADRPETLPGWLARHETWREPPPAPPADGLGRGAPAQAEQGRLRLARLRAGPRPVPAPPPAPTAATPLKLYQPAQGRFYLVAASLVCRRPGLPDRAVDRAHEEGCGFVVRLCVPAGDGAVCDPEAPETREYAFVPAGDGFVWHPVDPGARSRAAPGEERLKLFPVGWREPEGRRRRLLAGLIPAARREAYLGAAVAPAADDPAPEPPEDGRITLLRAEVLAPWEALTDLAAAAGTAMLENAGGTGTQRATAADAVLRRFRESAQTTSWYVLLDFARFLRDHLPVVWQPIAAGIAPPAAPTGASARLHAALHAIEAPLALRTDLAVAAPAATRPARLTAALTAALAAEAALEAVEAPFELPATAGWPGFLFLLAHPRARSNAPAGPPAAETGFADASLLPTGMPVGGLDGLAALVADALPATPTAPVPEALAPPPPAPAGEPWFALRCVYERPNCAGFAPSVTSRPSVAFRLASYFDPDAPVRPIRIPLPSDITPAALRRYKKGAGFVLSDLLCGQTQRFKRTTLGDLIRSVLPWPLHKGLPSGGGAPCGGAGNPFGLLVMISIPIVTIVAFILMIIMVTLFDLIFRWLPWLIVAVPIRGLKGKKP